MHYEQREEKQDNTLNYRAVQELCNLLATFIHSRHYC